MKSFVVSTSILMAVVVLIFIRCSSNNGEFFNGTPGIAQGTLTDNTGAPIKGATIWIPQGTGLALIFGGPTPTPTPTPSPSPTPTPGGGITDPEGDTCPSPGSSVENDDSGNPEQECTNANNGNFFLNCGTHSGNVGVQILNTDGTNITPNPTPTVNCGGPYQLLQLNVGPQPTP